MNINLIITYSRVRPSRNKDAGIATGVNGTSLAFMQDALLNGNFRPGSAGAAALDKVLGGRPGAVSPAPMPKPGEVSPAPGFDSATKNAVNAFLSVSGGKNVSEAFLNLNQMPKEDGLKALNQGYDKFLQAVPNEFKNEAAIGEMAKEMGFPDARSEQLFTKGVMKREALHQARANAPANCANALCSATGKNSVMEAILSGASMSAPREAQNAFSEGLRDMMRAIPKEDFTRAGINNLVKQMGVPEEHQEAIGKILNNSIRLQQLADK